MAPMTLKSHFYDADIPKYSEKEIVLERPHAESKS